MRASLAVQRSTVGDCERRAPSRLREQCSLPCQARGLVGRFAARSGLECRSRFSHFSCAFQHRGQLWSFQRLGRRHFPQFFPSILLLYPSSSSFIPHSLLPRLFILLFLLYSISWSSSPAFAIHTADLKVMRKYTQLLIFSGKWTLFYSKPLHDPNTRQPKDVCIRVCTCACADRFPTAGEGNEECSCCSLPNCHNWLVATSEELYLWLFDQFPKSCLDKRI